MASAKDIIGQMVVRAGTKAATEAERSLDKVVREALNAMRKDKLAYTETLPINAAIRGDITPENAKGMVQLLEGQSGHTFPDVLKYAHDVRFGVSPDLSYAGLEGRTGDDLTRELFKMSSDLHGEDIANVSKVVQDMSLQSLMANNVSPDEMLYVYRSPQLFGSIRKGATPKVEGALSFTQNAPRFFTTSLAPRDPAPSIQFEVPANKVLTDTSAFPSYASHLKDEEEIQALRKDAIRRMSFEDQYQMMKQLGMQLP